MALSAKNQKIMFYMLCEVVRNNGDDAAFAYYQQLQVDAFALNEIANFTARVLPALTAQASAIQTNELAPINAKITALS